MQARRADDRRRGFGTEGAAPYDVEQLDPVQLGKTHLGYDQIYREVGNKAQGIDAITRRHAVKPAFVETARNLVPKPVVDEVEEASIGIISLGSNDGSIEEARDRLRAAGIETSYLRLRALPISQTVYDFIDAHDKVIVVENNYDGQLHKILVMENPSYAPRMVSAAKCDGLPLSARWISEMVKQAVEQA